MVSYDVAGTSPDAPRPASGLRRQLVMLTALQALAAAVLGGPLLLGGVLVGDRLADYYFFRDTLHALNVYGEYPWWNPSIWAGFPQYYINILYWPGREPLFAILSGVVWLLGRAGLVFDSYQPLYVVYFAFLVPLLFSLSVLALARQVLRQTAARYLVIVLMAFSPGVVLSLSDLGSEVSAYGFLAAAAWLRFGRAPGRRTFTLLCLTAAALALAFSFFSLFWNIFFVPGFILATLAGRGGARMRDAVRRIPAWWWAAGAAAVLLCALPSVIAWSHGGDILSARSGGGRVYAYEALRPGTPLEALALSTPGVGFEWTDYDSPDATFAPVALSRDRQFSSFGYMGMLTLPLAILGLVAGRRYWSTRLLLLIAAALSTVMLSAFSPWMSMLLGWPSALRGVNHHGDMVFRLGLFALFALAAGLGVESLGRRAWRWGLLALFSATAFASLAWLIGLQGSAATANYLFGAAVAFVLVYAIALVRFALARTPPAAAAALAVLFCVMAADTATFAFAHLRLSLSRVSGTPVDPGAGAIGSVIGREETDFLYLRGLNDPALLEPAPPAGDTDVVARSYNTAAMSVTRSVAGHFEWDDAFFPFWRAWVNGTEVPVERSPSGMKMVPVPAGTSHVVFRFVPDVLRASVAAGYLVFGLIGIAWFRSRSSA